MARRKLAQDATLTLPGITRPVGRPRTGCAKTAAERMRAYRARRAAQAAEFPSPVTEIPDEWELPQPPAGYTADELERDNPFNQWMEDFSLQPVPVPSSLVQERQLLLDSVLFYRHKRTGNPYQQYLARMSDSFIRHRLVTLGGLASVW